jgi:hypothetical protein
MPVFDLNQYQLRSCADNIPGSQMSAAEPLTGTFLLQSIKEKS